MPRRHPVSDSLDNLSVLLVPRNDWQRTAIRAYQQNTICFFVGPAGTGKSHLAVALALDDLLRNRVENVVVIRPIIESCERLGYLPGTVEEKIGPWTTAILDVLGCMAFPGQAKHLFARIEFLPVAHCRGRTLRKTAIIVDEAENLDRSGFKLVLTRIGEGSKMIVTGDPTQSDLPKRRWALTSVAERLSKIDGITTVHFPAEAIVRHPLITQIVEALA